MAALADNLSSALEAQRRLPQTAAQVALLITVPLRRVARCQSGLVALAAGMGVGPLPDQPVRAAQGGTPVLVALVALAAPQPVQVLRAVVAVAAVLAVLAQGIGAAVPKKVTGEPIVAVA